MTIKEFFAKGCRFIKRSKRRLLLFLFQYPRKLKYQLLSSCSNTTGSPIVHQPVLFAGPGSISFNGIVNLGVSASAGFYSGYIYLEARKEQSKIVIEDGVWLNNNFTAVSEGEGIVIGKKTLIGTGVTIYDSDFHDLSPSRRMGGKPATGKVCVGENVFIGSNVTILKGVTIGDNSVIANGSIVNSDIPSDVIAGGYRAKY